VAVSHVSGRFKIRIFLRELKEHCIKPKKFFHNQHRILAAKNKIIPNPNIM
jgi:hypothetical protein